MFDGKPFSYKPIEKISKELFAGGDKPDDFSLQHNEVYRYPYFLAILFTIETPLP